MPHQYFTMLWMTNSFKQPEVILLSGPLTFLFILFC